MLAEVILNVSQELRVTVISNVAVSSRGTFEQVIPLGWVPLGEGEREGGRKEEREGGREGGGKERSSKE